MKKRIHKKPPRKIKKPQKKTNNKIITLIIIAATSILLGLAIGLYYGNQIDEVAHELTHDTPTQNSKNKEPHKLTYEEKTKALEISYANNVENNTYIEKPQKEHHEEKPTFHYEEPNLEEIDKKQIEETSVFSPPITEDAKPIASEEKKETLPKKSNNPKLVVIIDDMTTKKQIKNIQEIGYKVNMSFLPPTNGHRYSASITEGLENFLIHLPLQASNFRYEEENTLHIEDSLETIEKRIEYLREIYPNTNYLNNHTGSKFTSNELAMDKLFQILKKYNYTFIDSKTTAHSVALKVAKKYGVKMFSRNIFLDNKKEKKYIQNQLKKAIKIAKRNGLAIAIGHPYGVTFRTLKDSKYLLEGLDLVYVQEL